MKNDDVVLIRRILTGDESAFAELVNKYQKQVHVLAWRKIGDFHIAEDITQDTFLKVYQKLHTLKDPNQFSGWLYVITTNLCNTWLRKKRIQTQPLEDVEITMGQKDAYSQHVVEERANTAVETQREIVKKLLAKLKESERTVMTLHYLAEMTVEDISKFLGVSAGTIKSRLQRARDRLQKEETMIREALDHFQISPNLTDNIMREVARLKPGTPSGAKPLVPWIAAASSAVLIMLMLGIGSQYLARFQRPYSLDAQTEMAVELIDTPIVLNFEAEPDVQRQLGSANALGQNESDGKRPDEVLFAAAQSEGEDVSVPKQQWIQSEPIEGSKAYSMFPTPEGELYILGGRNPSILKLSSDGKRWQHIFDIILLNTAWGGNSPIAKWKNTLYVIPSNELFASTDEGKSWNSVNSWPEYGYPIELVLTEQAFYIAFMNGISRSEDAGKTWEGINDGIMGNIRSIVMIQNTLFVGTSEGLFRLEDDKWQRVEFPVSVGQIRSVAVTDEKLYVAAELSGEMSDPRKVSRGLQRSWWIFRSIDLGNSWTNITPTNAWNVKGWAPFVKLIAAGETLLAMEKGMVRSTDSGNTWMPVQASGTTPSMNADVDVAVVVNENDFYVGSSDDGLHHSTDKGKTWNKVNINRMSRVDNLILFKRNSREKIVPPILYARTDEKIRNTTNQGKSWNVAQLKIPMTALHKEEPPSITHILKYGGVIYAKGGDSLGRGKTRIYRISTIDGITLIPIQGMPIFDFLALKDRLSQNPSIEQSQEGVFGATQFFKQLVQWNPQQYNALIQLGFRGGPFAISGDTFYLEYNYKLFRWKMGDTEWYDTEQEETVELTLDIARKDLKLAVSGDTVYVGKRDGHLVVSYDRGDNWIDLTPALPFSVRTFKEIIVAGSTVYVATDAGIITSDDGRNWQVVTDVEGTNLIMEHLAVEGTTVYGVTKNTGIYRLKNGTWEQIVSDIPDGVTSLAVDGNMLYVGTQNKGMLHYNLEK
ncbi:MAG: sigma-70 family RNA polymerase sigma factor [Candidatus Poribacteria bacterium]|nr:sigma-70 family RNA polymerase sigma factor [Candidatus Poribacteria bacterium]